MIIVWRWWYFLGLAGLFLTVWGSIEVKHSAASGASPVAVSIDHLDRGEDVEQPFVRIGAHVALYGFTTSWVSEGEDRIHWSIYPVVPEGHAFVRALAAASGGDARDDHELPELESVHTFILTDKWRRERDLPGGLAAVAKAEGMLFRWSDLDKDEREVVRSIQPQVDPERVRLLELGRSPKPMWLCLAACAVGAVAGLIAIRLFFRGRAEGNVAADEPQQSSDEDSDGDGEAADSARERAGQ